MVRKCRNLYVFNRSQHKQLGPDVCKMSGRFVNSTSGDLGIVLKSHNALPLIVEIKICFDKKPSKIPVKFCKNVFFEFAVRFLITISSSCIEKRKILNENGQCDMKMVLRL